MLHRHWDHDTFRLRREVAIRSVTAARVVVTIFGCGETIRYQVPAFLLGGLTIVVTQLITLMRGQMDGLSARGMKAISTNHTLSAQKTDSRWTNIEFGRYRCVYVSPECLFS